MRYRRRSKLDPSQVTDARGRRAGPLAIGGGGVGIAAVVIVLLLNALSGGDASSAFDLLEGQEISNGQGSAQLQEECRTGADANRRQDCRIVADVNSIQAYWQGAFFFYYTATTVIYTRDGSLADRARS